MRPTPDHPRPAKHPHAAVARPEIETENPDESSQVVGGDVTEQSAVSARTTSRDPPATPPNLAPDTSGGIATATEAEVITQSRHEPERFAAIFDTYFSEIHGYVSRRLGGDARDAADDLAAETFLTAFRKRGRFDAARGSVRAWLYGIATNLIRRHRRDELRRYRALARQPLESPDTDHGNPVTDHVLAADMSRGLARALAALPSRDRDALLLVALGELSYDEVAAALGIPTGTVASRVNGARRKLRKHLETTNDSTSHDIAEQPLWTS